MANINNNDEDEKPLVSIILPAYNEESIIKKNVGRLYDYLETLNGLYIWEILVINDGSTDQTGDIAESLAETNNNLRVYHHKTNRNLGTALRTGFQNTLGEFVIVLDIDLSYAPEHIGRLLSKMEECDADMVIASPYMEGGRNTAVPRLRLLLSKTVNYMMRRASGLKIYTFTGMVRVFKGGFIRSLNTKSSTFDINSELIFKAYILRAKVIEIPAHLDWSEQRKLGKIRTSSLRIIKGIFNGLVNSFIFRPYLFFWMLGIAIFLISLYIIIWIFVNTYLQYPMAAELTEGLGNTFSLAVSMVYKERPYSFVVGGVTLIISIQIMGLGFISLQKKRYFDELFHLNSAILKATKKS
ncbi:Glycosyltransferase involved in cell wall bisynthesis [Pricia antarctica]|uniref:Glycosyltransferase involved in cell wall bisynthesis n=1 Tax=Pricia antarctica TaxID=641691 RepID=A0A1G6YSU4_9FLAO|nr:glycosyltransferase family 2 protein [Pricia antarctica]SDD92727.1 Glycosyltransferase involved in cell wall bisynthesis [Pricia antarctica]